MLVVPATDFAFSAVYRVFVDNARLEFVVEDAEQNPVAVFPVQLGGEVRTRTDHWEVLTERQKLSWAMVARRASDREDAGGIVEGFVPNTHKLWIVPDLEYRVTQNPLNGNWTLSQGHNHLVHFTDVASFARARAGRRAGSRVATGTITTLDPPTNPVSLALPILLTLELIKAEANAPVTSDNGASMIY